MKNSKKLSNINRRQFLESSMKAGIALSMPVHLSDLLTDKIEIAVITDLHQDIMHDAPARLSVFLDAARRFKPDALLQMGDFAVPKEVNRDIISQFNKAHAQSLHVLGNHDTDGGFTQQQTMSMWGMPDRYYSKSVRGIRFIILDGNEKGSPIHKSGYPSYIGKQQVSWLKDQLSETKEPVIVVSHQPLAGPMAIDNADVLQEVLSQFSDKILLAINGHTHIDGAYLVDNVNYVHINSASYFWAGDPYKHESYSKSIHETHPWIAYTFPYQEALFTRLTINPGKRIISIEGKKSKWQGKSPSELGYKINDLQLKEDNIVPYIGRRSFKRI